MKLKHIFLGSLGALALASVTYGSDLESERAAQTNNAFGWSLFERAQRSAEPTENMLLSPLSAWLALSLASNGAEKETLAEMNQLLAQSGWTRAEVNNAALSLLRDLTDATETEETLRVANAVWTNSDIFTLSEDFVSDAETYYRIKPDVEIVRSESFSNPLTVQNINDWVSRSTNGMIPTIIDELDRDMATVLLNALFFEGQWYTPFDSWMTQDKAFRMADGKDLPVRMMRSTRGRFHYSENGDYKMLSLGFRAGSGKYGQPLEGRFVVDLVLPSDENGNLFKLDEALYQNLISSSQRSLVEVQIPKFKFTYENLLNDELQAAGIVRAFDPDAAQFNRLGDARGPGNAFISKVLQKTAVEMDEAGFKAAAVTAITLTTTSLPPEPKLNFIADRPFFLALRDSKTGALIFQGVVARPQFP